jgi:hypothetical protein
LLEVAIQSNGQAITNGPHNKREILLRLLALIPRAAKRNDQNGRTALALAAEGGIDVNADVNILHQLWAACPEASKQLDPIQYIACIVPNSACHNSQALNAAIKLDAVNLLPALLNNARGKR